MLLTGKAVDRSGGSLDSLPGEMSDLFSLEGDGGLSKDLLLFRVGFGELES